MRLFGITARVDAGHVSEELPVDAEPGTPALRRDRLFEDGDPQPDTGQCDCRGQPGERSADDDHGAQRIFHDASAYSNGVRFAYCSADTRYKMYLGTRGAHVRAG
jgi:hypothetical protein